MARAPYNFMANHRVPSNEPITSQQTHTALHQSHGHVRRNPNVFGDDQQDVHLEGVPQPVGNVVMQNEMQYPPRINVPDYNVAHYRPPPSPYLEVPYVHMHRDVGVAEAVPAQAHPFAPNQEVQGNYDHPFGYGAQLRAADPPEAVPDIWPHPAPPADMPPGDGLRSLAGRYLNNPDTRVNVLRIEPGPGGRFEVWIALELADIF